jgi:hypothetical protein
LQELSTYNSSKNWMVPLPCMCDAVCGGGGAPCWGNAPSSSISWVGQRSMEKLCTPHSSSRHCHPPTNTFVSGKNISIWGGFEGVHVMLGHTMSADHPQVGMGNPRKIPAGFVPVAPDQIIPTVQARSGWRSQNFAGTRGYLLRLLTAMIYEWD